MLTSEEIDADAALAGRPASDVRALDTPPVDIRCHLTSFPPWTAPPTRYRWAADIPLVRENDRP